MVENEEMEGTSLVGPYVHEARKDFTTIEDAIRAACWNSYSLGNSDIGIFNGISSIEEAMSVIDAYYQENEGRYNLPQIETTSTYDNLITGMLEYEEEGGLPNSICYKTSTGTNTLMIRRNMDKDGNVSYTAIYQVKSGNILQKSSAMQSFSEDGWDCRCISLARNVEKSAVGIVLPSDYENLYACDRNLSKEELERLGKITGNLPLISVKEDDYDKALIKSRMLKAGIHPTGIRKLELINCAPKWNNVRKDGEYIDGEFGSSNIGIYEIPKDGEGTVISVKKRGDVYLETVDVTPSSCTWDEDVREDPPSEKSLRMMDQMAIKEGIELWTDTDKQLKITRKIQTDLAYKLLESGSEDLSWLYDLPTELREDTTILDRALEMDVIATIYYTYSRYAILKGVTMLDEAGKKHLLERILVEDPILDDPEFIAKLKTEEKEVTESPMYTPEDIVEGISPRQGEIDKVLKETTERVKPPEVNKGQTQVDE